LISCCRQCGFFRPGFTQGAWIDGEPWKGFHYELFAGDGLNTLTVPTGNIDPHHVYSGSEWWEPLGTYGIPGTRARTMYDDYQDNEKPKVRFGTSFTTSKENRFFSLGEGNPENTGLYNSDGVNTFATGAFAPGVTVTDVTYRMPAADWGVKWRGFSLWITCGVSDQWRESACHLTFRQKNNIQPPPRPI
jgi:hypothetical protein